MARLSIVIPVVNGLKGFEDTLVSVLENRPADCQIVVVFNQPYDDPYDIEDEVDFVRVAPRAGLAESLAQGLLAAEAPVIHLLTAGVQVGPGWAEHAMERFADPDVGAVAPVVLDGLLPERVVCAGLAYSAGGSTVHIGAGRPINQLDDRRMGLCGPDPLAAFYRKTALEAILPMTKQAGDTVVGIEIALLLRQAGLRCIVEPECRTYADPTLAATPNSLRKGFDAERLFWRWASYYGWGRSLISHLGVLALECLSCVLRPATVCKLAGRAWGALGLPTLHRQQPVPTPAPTVTPRVQPIGPPHFLSAEYRKTVESRT